MEIGVQKRLGLQGAVIRRIRVESETAKDRHRDRAVPLSILGRPGEPLRGLKRRSPSRGIGTNPVLAKATPELVRERDSVASV